MKSIFLPIGIFSLLALSACGDIDTTDKKNELPRTSEIIFEETSYDFGLIQQSGGKVSHDFVFTYQGDTPITVTGTPTSCACTAASINKKLLSKNDSGVLTVTFNPNLHAEPEGRFFKTVTILTDPPLTEQPEVKIWIEINLDLGKDAYELKNDNHADDE